MKRKTERKSLNLQRSYSIVHLCRSHDNLNVSLSGQGRQEVVSSYGVNTSAYLPRSLPALCPTIDQQSVNTPDCIHRPTSFQFAILMPSPFPRCDPVSWYDLTSIIHIIYRSRSLSPSEQPDIQRGLFKITNEVQTMSFHPQERFLCTHVYDYQPPRTTDKVPSRACALPAKSFTTAFPAPTKIIRHNDFGQS
jgi:hypothetical protein